MKASKNNIFLIDGFPITINQAEHFTKTVCMPKQIFYGSSYDADEQMKPILEYYNSSTIEYLTGDKLYVD